MSKAMVRIKKPFGTNEKYSLKEVKTNIVVH